jgi:hypothetical protein
VIVFPLQMSKTWFRALQIVIGYPITWEEHADSTATAFYCRGLAQNVTMVGFLGWLTILHFGQNSRMSVPSIPLRHRKIHTHFL